MRWDSTLSRIISKVCNRNSQKTSDGKEAVEVVFRMIRKCMTEDEMPKVLLAGLGTFKVKPHRLEYLIKKLPEFEERGLIDSKERVELEKRYNSILERRLKEDGKVRGNNTDTQD